MLTLALEYPYMLATMAAVLLSWSVLILAFSGLGYAVFRICRFEKEEDRFFFAFWTGFCLVLFFLQLWHLAMPVNRTVLILILITGGCSFLLSIREYADDVRKFAGKYQLLLIVGLALFASNRALAPIKLFDAGLYHLSAIQWNLSFPIVRGLGNLMNELGMNNAYFLYHALLDSLPSVRSFHVANGLLLFMLLLQMMPAFFRIAKKQGDTSDWFLLILLPATFGQLLDHAEDTSADLAIFVFGVLIGSRLCRSLFSESTDRQRTFDVFYVSLLATTATTIKITAIVFGLIAVLIVLGRRKSAVLWLVPAFCIFAVWIIGNVLLTGYPLYPSSIFPFSSEWKMPLQKISVFKYGIVVSARNPNGNWFLSLFQQRQNLFEVVVPVLLFAGAIFSSKTERGKILLLFAPAFFSILFWLQAPAPRFAAASFWWMAAAVLAPLLYRSRIEFKYLCLVLLTACLVVSRVYYAPIVVRKGPVFQYPVALTRFTTDSGLIVSVPVQLRSCWESPIPCMAIPNRSLRLLQKDDPGSGFTLSP